jgi:hypothetical protein
MSGVGIAGPEAPADAEVQRWIAEQTFPVSFLVAGSFSDYGSALRLVERIRRRTELEVNLRGLTPFGGGLSLSKEDCGEARGYDYPCWYPRGRIGEGEDLSIERSEWYPPMKPGFFIVVAASGDRDEVDPVKARLAKAGIRGYVRTVPIYMGCMH